MRDDIEQTIINHTKQLVDAGSSGDLDAYNKRVAEDVTAVVPQSRSHPVSGRDFHEFYFRLDHYDRPVNNTINNVQVRRLSEDTVLIVYNLLQQTTIGGDPETRQFTETRIWEKRSGSWINIHLHRTRVS